MAQKKDLGITFEEFNSIIDSAIASVDDEIEQIANEVWEEREAQSPDEK